ncbi:MAG: sulfotransferase, partial [Gammaproteobacteria bacterium]|nr:sulfotransferase [Gammaproteobacteria bacterium]
MHNLAIEPPFFIVGSGRSGSSILYQLLAVHPQLCWVSRLTDRFPWAPWLSRAHRLLDLP